MMLNPFFKDVSNLHPKKHVPPVQLRYMDCWRNNISHHVSGLKSFGRKKNSNSKLLLPILQIKY